MQSGGNDSPQHQAAAQAIHQLYLHHAQIKNERAELLQQLKAAKTDSERSAILQQLKAQTDAHRQEIEAVKAALQKDREQRASDSKK